LVFEIVQVSRDSTNERITSICHVSKHFDPFIFFVVEIYLYYSTVQLIQIFIALIRPSYLLEWNYLRTFNPNIAVIYSSLWYYWSAIENNLPTSGHLNLKFVNQTFRHQQCSTKIRRWNQIDYVVRYYCVLSRINFWQFLDFHGEVLMFVTFQCYKSGINI